MPLDLNDFACSRQFIDAKKYPRGFHRSGEFSRKESDLLTRHGALLKDLMNGTIEPSNDAQVRFVEVSQGRAEAENELEKVWLKYLAKTNQKPLRFTCSSMGMAIESGAEDISAEL